MPGPILFVGGDSEIAKQERLRGSPREARWEAESAADEQPTDRLPLLDALTFDPPQHHDDQEGEERDRADEDRRERSKLRECRGHGKTCDARKSFRPSERHLEAVPYLQQLSLLAVEARLHPAESAARGVDLAQHRVALVTAVGLGRSGGEHRTDDRHGRRTYR